jgi:lipid-A-disaccharide synthase-like uncharacterized protein
MSIPLAAPSTNTIWLSVSFLGQAMFFMRFFVQWVASEKLGQSVIPKALWYFSIAGSLILLSYASWKHDPVFVLGQSFGFLVYTRNLYLLRKAKDRPPTE